MLPPRAASTTPSTISLKFASFVFCVDDVDDGDEDNGDEFYDAILDTVWVHYRLKSGTPVLLSSFPAWS